MSVRGFLWLQDKVAKKVLKIDKVKTGDQLADLLTKPMTRAWVIEKELDLCLEFRTGRSAKQKHTLAH